MVALTGPDFVEEALEIIHVLGKLGVVDAVVPQGGEELGEPERLSDDPTRS